MKSVSVAHTKQELPLKFDPPLFLYDLWTIISDYYNLNVWNKISKLKLYFMMLGNHMKFKF